MWGMATVVNMRDAKSNLSRLAQRAASREEILIAKNGKPVGRLTRVTDASPGTLVGALKAKIHMADDFDATPAEFED
jgi:prevent-host-death family protein